jgi:hypothetical protein
MLLVEAMSGGPQIRSWPGGRHDYEAKSEGAENGKQEL